MKPGDVLLHYRLVEQIGEGGMGVVWKAIDTTLDREVAIKILPQGLAADPERLARFEREAKVLASLNHPNVATVHGFHEADGVRFLVMELVPGETLEERIKRGAMPPGEAISVARKIVDGIEYAHERGIVHRDLKPANVKLTGDGGVKVLDFGLAKAIAGDPMSSGPTSTPTVIPTLTSMGTVAGMILGTAAYMSPEQARGVNIDRRADIWAFGAVLYEMLTAKRAFDGETVSDTLASVLRAPVEWESLPASTPASVVRLLRRCLERDVKKRLRDIGEARIALETMDAEEASSTSASAAPPAARPFLPWALFAVAVLAALGLGARGLMQPPPAKPAVTRFQITTDPKLARMEWPRLSPDGRILAFLGTEAGGRTSIWLRPVDSTTPYLLAGTEGVNGRPFWSPDSKYLAYFEGTQLKKIPVAGGPTQSIGEAEFGADGAWGSNGIIIFDGRNATDSIRQISATGGKATYVFDEDTRKVVPNNAWPYFLPDGKHFLFTSNRTGSSIARITICVGTVGSQETKALTPTESRVEYANGYLIYVLRGTLIAHRFDAERLEVIGDPIPLADHVSANGTRANYSVSQNGIVAFLAGASGTDLSQLIWVDRAGKELGKEDEPGLYGDIALSPDGKWLAYASRESIDGNRDIWLRDLERHTSSRFTFDPADDFRPVWSPDGTKIYFASNRKDDLFRCYVKAANGGGTETVVIEDSQFHFVPSSVTAGGLLALDRFGAGSTAAVVVARVDGSGERVVVPGATAQSSGRLSRDGRFLAYLSNETRALEVYVQNWPPGGGKWQVSQGGAGQLRWKADGTEMFYRSPDFDFFSVPVTLGSQFSAGMPKLMFRRRVVTGGNQGTQAWTIASGGEKFLLNAVVGDSSAPTFTVILNWPETLQAR